MRIGNKLKQFVCKHNYMPVWLDDYREHVLGERDRLLRLSGKTIIRYCPKCGKVEKETRDVPIEEVYYADRTMVCHFEEGDAQ